MGLERNSDLVVMECYAPLLVNVNPGASQWPTNLIGYDALTSFGSPSYWMQVMFGQNRGDVMLPTELSVPPTIAATEPVPHGAIGVGTWHTNAEYKDIVVTGPDGQTLLAADLSKDTSGWKISGGKWNTQDSAIKQSAENAECFATIGDVGWTNYTITLKARKISGAEGFMVLAHVHDANNFVWWNVGGWGDTQCGFEGTYDGGRDEFGTKVEGTVDADRWYDLKVEVDGHHFRGYLDGKLINDAVEQSVPVLTPVFATASYIRASGEVVLKLVNASTDTVDAAIHLRGVGSVSPDGKAIVLAGKSPNDVNTVREPMKVAPQEMPISDASASFHRSVPPLSITLLRLKASPQ
jgi:alpha-L-arabinofuranosidase